jgi:hypothetical protein
MSSFSKAVADYHPALPDTSFKAFIIEWYV